MQSFVAGQANTVGLDLVNRSTGAPIVVGTVTFYLVARDGDNAGKWWDAITETWSAVEISAGDGIHESEGHWICEIVAIAWVTEVQYRLYAIESGNLHIPYSDTIMELNVPVDMTVEGVVVQS